MKRQLYAEGGLKSLLDIIASNPDKFGDILNILENVPRGDYMKTGPKMTPRYKLMPRGNELSPASEEEVREMLREKPMVEDMLDRGEGDRTPKKMPLLRGDDEEVMERLMELQKNPEYQYDEENMYEGPRDMRMTGGITNAPIVNNRVNAFGGFGGFFSGVGDILGGAADFVGDVAEKAVDVADPVLQVASFIPGPHQPFAQAYTMGRGAGIGGDYGGFQIGGFTPSGGTFGVGSGTGGGVFGSGTGGTFGTPGSVPGIPGIPGVPSDVSNAIRIGSQFVDTRQGGGGTGRQPSTTGDILGTLLNVGVSAYGAYQSKKEQEKINELKRQQYEEEKRRYDEFLARQARKRRQYAGQESLPGMTVTGRNVAKSDIIGRRGAGFGGMLSNFIAQNPQIFSPVSQQSNQPSPINITMDVRNRSKSFGQFMDENRNGIDDREEMYLRGNMKKGGITDLNIRTNPQGVKEIDYRQKGGFVPPIGIKEKADDIPAMLSNNEFVFTADAVRGAGKGNVNEGAKKMYALMKKLEAGGKA